MDENIRPSMIPNRLKNASKEHPYVAGSVDIYDDDIKMKQSDINKIVEDNLVSVSLSASAGSPVAIGSQGSVTLTATSKIVMDNIVIKKDDDVLKTETDKDSCRYTDNAAASYGLTAYRAEFDKGGIHKTANVTVGAIYYGYGDAPFSEGSTWFVVNGGVSGTYEIVIPSGLASDPHVWFMVPQDWTISKSTKSGFDFPLKPAVEVTVSSGEKYYAYESKNTYGAGTERVVLS